MRTLHRTPVVLTLPKAVPALVKVMHAIITAMTQNKWFPNAGALLASALANLNALDAAEQATQSRAAGLVPARNARLVPVYADADALKGVVQQACNAAPPDAETIARSAGMGLRKLPQRQKPPLAAKAGSISGTVALAALAIPGAGSYDWQMSLDEKTWTALPGTKLTRTTIAGLTPGTTLHFRVRAIANTGPTNWSQVVCIVVT